MAGLFSVLMVSSGLGFYNHSLYMATLAAEKGWSVRQTEQAARRKEPRGPEKPAAKPADARRNPNVLDLEKRLSAALGMPVAVRTDASGKAGTVEIAWDDLDQLDRFVDRVLGQA